MRTSAEEGVLKQEGGVDGATERRRNCRMGGHRHRVMQSTSDDGMLQVTHHESEVVKAIEQELALILRQPNMLQPLSHRLVQGFTTGPIC